MVLNLLVSSKSWPGVWATVSARAKGALLTCPVAGNSTQLVLVAVPSEAAATAKNMGGVPSVAEQQNPRTVHDFKPPENWRLEHVEAVHRHFINGNFDFGLDKSTWERFLKEAIPTAEDAAVTLYRKFDTNDARMVNVVEVMSGLCIMCQATVIDKARFLFDMHDFNGQGTLSYDELVVMLYLTATERNRNNV